MTSLNRAQQPILVGIDGSKSALEAVRWAATEAHRRRVGLHLVEAFGWTPTPYSPEGAVEPQLPEMLRQAGRDRVSAAAAVAAEIAPQVAVTAEVLTGFPVPRLLTEATQAQLVVIGDRGLGGFTGLLAGSVAVAMAAHAACPVVVVRGTESGQPVPTQGPVIVGIDGSPTSEAALAFAYEQADARRAPLVAVHAWRDLVLDPWMAPLIDWDLIEADEHRLLAERLSGWGAKYPDITVDRVVVKDRPAHALLERSAGAQLVVVGSHGRGGFTGMLMGSVSRTLVMHAACPVAVIRPNPAQD